MKEFRQAVTVSIGAIGKIYVFPVVAGRILPVPDLPGGGKFVTETTRGVRKYRPLRGWYLDVELSWPELTKETRALLVEMIGDVVTLDEAAEVMFTLGEGYDAQTAWSVLLDIDQEAVALIYSESVRRREVKIGFKARTSVGALPAWMSD